MARLFQLQQWEPLFTFGKCKWWQFLPCKSCAGLQTKYNPKGGQGNNLGGGGVTEKLVLPLHRRLVWVFFVFCFVLNREKLSGTNSVFLVQDHFPWLLRCQWLSTLQPCNGRIKIWLFPVGNSLKSHATTLSAPWLYTSAQHTNSILPCVLGSW